MARHPLCLVAACVLAAGAASGGEPAPEIGELLARARQAWRQGEVLESKAQAALADGGGSYVKLLEQEDAAYASAERAFREALGLAPLNPNVRAEYGRFWLARREWNQARKFLEAALRCSQEAAQRGGGMGLLPQEEADIRRALGGVLERAGDNAVALEHYRKACVLDQANARNRLSLAVGLCATGAPQEALPLLRPWAEGAGQAGPPDRPDKAPGILALGLYTLALAQEEMGYYEDALANYRKAQALAEQAGRADAAGIANRAVLATARLEEFFEGLQKRAQQRARENEERRKRKLEPLPDERESLVQASALCDQGCRLKANALEDASFLKVLAQVRGGVSHHGVVEKHPSYEGLAAAMARFEQAIAKAPRLARAYYELAVCSVMLGRLGTARKLLDEAAHNSPNNLAALNLQGEVLLELGQWEEAARAFSRLLELELDSGRANFGLARACAGLQGSAEQCRTALDALLNAQRLGVRDKRMLDSLTLVLKDGREVGGYITEEPEAYLLHGGDKPERIAKMQVHEARREPGMQEQLLALVQRFERGEQPAPRPLIRGPKGGARPKPAETLDPWRGSLIER